MLLTPKGTVDFDATAPIPAHERTLEYLRWAKEEAGRIKWRDGLCLHQEQNDLIFHACHFVVGVALPPHVVALFVPEAIQLLEDIKKECVPRSIWELDMKVGDRTVRMAAIQMIEAAVVWLNKTYTVK